MTDYSTHRPCEVLALNGVDLALAINYLYKQDVFANYGPLTHFIVITEISTRKENFPTIENSVVGLNSQVSYSMKCVVYNKNTGAEVEIINDNTKFSGVFLEKYANGERVYTLVNTIIPGGD